MAGDYVELTGIYGYGAIHLEGDIPGGTEYVWNDVLGYGLQFLPMIMTTKSVGSVEKGTMELAAFEVCCSASPGPTEPYSYFPIIWGARESGVLLGTGDVVYFKFVTGPNSGNPDDRINIALSATTNNDFDLYVGCGVKPTYTSYALRSFAPYTEEFLSFRQNEICVYGETIWIAVHSYSGLGQFDLQVSPSRDVSAGRPFRVGVAFAPMSAERDAIRSDVSKGLRRYYAATEGQHYIPEALLYLNAPSSSQFDCTCGADSCDVCYIDSMLTASGGAGSSFVCDPATTLSIDDASDIAIARNGWIAGTGTTLAHELGHALFCQRDEYEGDLDELELEACNGRSTCSRCETTLMNVSPSPTNNFCVASDHGTTEVCSEGGSCSEPTPDAGWDIPQNLIFKPFGTPDPRSLAYLRRPRNGAFCGVPGDGLKASPPIYPVPAGTNDYYATAWDVTASEAIEVETVYFRPGVTGDVAIRVWIRSGTAVGHTSSSSGWTLVYDKTHSLTEDVERHFTFDELITIPSGSTYGFYMTPSDPSVRLVSYEAGAPISYGDSRAQVTTYSVNLPSFGGTFPNYRGDVGIGYRYFKDCAAGWECFANECVKHFSGFIDVEVVQ